MDKLTLTRQFQIQLEIFFGRYWEGIGIIWMILILIIHTYTEDKGSLMDLNSLSTP